SIVGAMTGQCNGSMALDAESKAPRLGGDERYAHEAYGARSTSGDAPVAVEARQPVAVDIAIPIYNAPHDLERCVESVLAHTTLPYRLLLIDDGSADPGVAMYLDGL